VEIGEILKEHGGEALVSVRISTQGSIPQGKILRIVELKKGKGESLDEASNRVGEYFSQKKAGPEAKNILYPEQTEILSLKDEEQFLLLMLHPEEHLLPLTEVVGPEES
jgi:hypothetical protein